MTFATRLTAAMRPYGPTKAAALCGVTKRSLQIWRSGVREPCLAMQVGVLAILSAPPAQGLQANRKRTA